MMANPYEECSLNSQQQQDQGQDVQYTVLTPVIVENSNFNGNCSDNYYGFNYVAGSACSTDNEETSDSNEVSLEEMQKPGDLGNKPDPFAPECRIPLPGYSADFTYLDTKTFVRRRNERERARVRNVNEGFERLRQHLPMDVDSKDKRLSKGSGQEVANRRRSHATDNTKC